MDKERAPRNNEREFFGLTIDDAMVKLISISDAKLGGSILSYNTASIPSGVVKQGQIKAPNRLAKIITKLRREAKPKPERRAFCVIGLPEDQIFIQTIEIPKELSEPEVSRAIEHQSNRLFPVSYQKIVLDWQVIKETKKKQRILVIAAPAKMVDLLVETTQLAKIQPLAIEPKSFALHRVLSYILKKQSLILVDFEQESASLSIYEAGEIKFHTKIGSPLTVEAVAGAISRTRHYYKDKNPKAKEIKRVIFSGDTGEKYFMEQVGQHFPKIQVEKITLPEFKASKDFNERRVFLASAIALSLKKIDLFAKHQSINLLPTEIKSRYRVQLTEHYLGLFARLTVWFFLLLVGGLAIFNYWLKLDSQAIADLIVAKENSQIPTSLQTREEVIERINRKSARIVQLHQNQTNIPQLIRGLTKMVPSQLSLATISIAGNKGTIAGIGPRSEIIQFRERLAEHPKINEVNLPLSSLEREQEADFRLEFTIEP